MIAVKIVTTNANLTYAMSKNHVNVGVGGKKTSKIVPSRSVLCLLF